VQQRTASASKFWAVAVLVVAARDPRPEPGPTEFGTDRRAIRGAPRAGVALRPERHTLGLTVGTAGAAGGVGTGGTGTGEVLGGTGDGGGGVGAAVPVGAAGATAAGTSGAGVAGTSLAGAA
jgi:hypothetical protein